MPADFKFGLVKGIRQSERRAVGFLTGDRDLNASAIFDALKETRQLELRVSFELWIAGQENPAKRFHGFPNDKSYSMCFVFKVKENRLNHRFYGFLCNPQPNVSPRLRVCVLCIHTTKNEWNTDPAILGSVRALSMNDEVRRAISAVFPDKVDNKKGQILPWKN